MYLYTLIMSQYKVYFEYFPFLLEKLLFTFYSESKKQVL